MTPPHSSSQAPASPRLFVLLLAALTMLGPFSIVTYLPSFPEMSRAFDATPVQMQLTLSAYLVTFSFMTLFHGAISDSFGRRSVILVNLVLYVVACVGCALAQAFEQLLVFRALQGLSAGGGIVVGRAMIRDHCAGAEAQRMMSLVTMLFGIAPAVGPIVGGWLQAAFGWRAVFGFLTLFSGSLLACCYWRLPESLPRASRQPFEPRPLLANYLMVGRNARYWLLSSALAFNFTGLFLYISSAPAIVYRLLGLHADQFAWLFLPSISGYIFGSYLSGRLAGKMSPEKTIAMGYAQMFVAIVGAIAYHLIWPATIPWTVLLLAMFTIGLSLAMPSLTLLALDLFPDNRGLASSLLTFQNTFFNTITASAVAPFAAASALGLALTAGASVSLGAMCAAGYFVLRKRSSV